MHTLFESGTSKIQDLERYITDDIKRHGTRLSDLERKLVNAYRDSVSTMAKVSGGCLLLFYRLLTRS